MALIAFPVGLLAFAFVWVSGMPYTSHLPRIFSAERWNAADPGVDSIRCSMITDLKYRTGIVGKTRSDLEKMLGKSESLARDPTASYWALCPSFIDIWVLRVRWENDRVIEAIVHDT